MKLEIGLPWFLRWVQASWDLCKGLVGMSASEATCGGEQSDWEMGLMTEEGATHQQMQAASGSQESRGESRYWSLWERHQHVLIQWLWALHNRKVTQACDFKPWAVDSSRSLTLQKCWPWLGLTTLPIFVFRFPHPAVSSGAPSSACKCARTYICVFSVLQIVRYPPQYQD